MSHMKNLILHPTDISQWHALVSEAQMYTSLVLDESTESYLVFLLMRFSQTPHLVDSVLAMDLLESLQVIGKRQVTMLREVGDKSLLLCGLFPGMAQRHHVKVEYFSQMGQAAYLTAAELEERHNAQLYFQLSAQFLTLQQVLQAMRRDSGHRLAFNEISTPPNVLM